MYKEKFNLSAGGVMLGEIF